ncbi:MAG: chorismate mutase [Candidatus Methanoplasma sp.]|jgi:chorismate mutase|nr:chorismate mutase [Candidatus Methanoplasma sp.]
MDLEELRNKIRETDIEILELMKKRIDLAIEVGKYKKDHKEGVRNLSVEEKVIKRYREFAEENGIDPDFAEEICKLLMKESVNVQEALIENHSR